ncbi:TPA: hypothetical protein DDZ86_05095 [Candidatus Dependentiae bacterium]|nr:MAG: hypothetical protein A2Y17_09900 [Clostridiales bacterium GWF2_38_85]HBL98988.1 hypothetical protein [Candidatus Dependentiae bacterium]
MKQFMLLGLMCSLFLMSVGVQAVELDLNGVTPENFNTKIDLKNKTYLDTVTELRLGVGEVASDQLSSLLAAVPSVENLVIRGMGPASFENLTLSKDALPALKELGLFDLKMPSKALETILQAAPKLEELSIFKRFELTDLESLVIPAGALQNLKGLEANRFIPFELIEAVVGAAPKLEFDKDKTLDEVESVDLVNAIRNNSFSMIKSGGDVPWVAWYYLAGLVKKMDGGKKPLGEKALKQLQEYVVELMKIKTPPSDLYVFISLLVTKGVFTDITYNDELTAWLSQYTGKETAKIKEITDALEKLMDRSSQPQKQADALWKVVEGNAGADKKNAAAIEFFMEALKNGRGGAIVSFIKVIDTVMDPQVLIDIANECLAKHLYYATLSSINQINYGVEMHWYEVVLSKILKKGIEKASLTNILKQNSTRQQAENYKKIIYNDHKKRRMLLVEALVNAGANQFVMDPDFKQEYLDSKKLGLEDFSDYTSDELTSILGDKERIRELKDIYEIVIEDNSEVTAEQLSKLLNGAPAITHLRLKGIPQKSLEKLSIKSTFRQLTKLELIDMVIPSEFVDKLLKNSPNLVQLNLAGSVTVPGDFGMDVKLPKLKTLILPKELTFTGVERLFKVAPSLEVIGDENFSPYPINATTNWGNYLELLLRDRMSGENARPYVTALEQALLSLVIDKYKRDKASMEGWAESIIRWLADESFAQRNTSPVAERAAIQRQAPVDFLLKFFSGVGVNVLTPQQKLPLFLTALYSYQNTADTASYTQLCKNVEGLITIPELEIADFVDLVYFPQSAKRVATIDPYTNLNLFSFLVELAGKEVTNPAVQSLALVALDRVPEGMDLGPIMENALKEFHTKSESEQALYKPIIQKLMDKGVRPLGKIKPRGIALLFDNSERIEKDKLGAIGKNLRALLKTPTVPVMTTGSLLPKCFDLIDADQWLVFKSIPYTGQDLFLLVPKSYGGIKELKNYTSPVNVPESTEITPLELKLGLKIDHFILQDIDVLKKSVFSDLDYNFSDVVSSVIYKKTNDMAEPWTSELFVTKYDRNRYCESVSTPTKKVSPKAHPLPPFTIYISGHGSPATEKLSGIGLGNVAGLKGEAMQVMLDFFNSAIETAWVILSTCFGGGTNIRQMMRQEGAFFPKKYGYLLALSNSNDTVSLTIEESGFKYLFSMGVPKTAYEAEKALSSIFLAPGPRSIVFKSKSSTVFLVKKPNQEWAWPAYLTGRVVSISNTMAKARTEPLKFPSFFMGEPQVDKKTLKTNRPEVLLLYADYIPFPLVFEELPLPIIESVIPGSAVHEFDEIRQVHVTKSDALCDIVTAFLLDEDIQADKVFVVKKAFIDQVEKPFSDTVWQMPHGWYYKLILANEKGYPTKRYVTVLLKDQNGKTKESFGAYFNGREKWAEMQWEKPDPQFGEDFVKEVKSHMWGKEVLPQGAMA